MAEQAALGRQGEHAVTTATQAPMRIVEETHFGDRTLRCFVPRPSSFVERFAEICRAHPAHDAVVDGTTRLSYRDLSMRVDRAAAGLRAAGAQPGARVAIALGNRWQFVVSLLAAMRAGLVAVPLNVRLSGAELCAILADCGAAGLIAEPGVHERVAANPPASLRRRYTVGASGRRIEEGFDSLLAERPPLPPAAPDEEATAVILYTSGTTGAPKGAMLTHFNIVHSCLHYVHGLAIDHRDRSVLTVPASHVTGAVAIIATMLYVGGTVIMMRSFDARGLLELASRERMTHTVMVPAMYNLCLMRAEFGDYDLSHWRVGAYGGAPMPQATIEALAKALPQLGLVNAYGATETTSPATLMPLGETAVRSDSVGKRVPCARIRVVDEQGNDVPAGEPGEIWIAGPMVVPGYWGSPPAAAESFAGPYWRSGDVGSVDADGYLCVRDRIKDMINRGGYKIYSVEVENTLKYHPDVADAAVVAVPDPVLGEKVRAVVQLAAGASGEARASRSDIAGALSNFCAERLADYKVPEFFTFTNEPLPRNAAGKILKRELRDRSDG